MYGLGCCQIVADCCESSVSSLNEYQPVALTLIVMCFKRLVMGHIKTMLSSSLDPAVRIHRHRNRHFSAPNLSHLDNKDTCLDAIHRL